MFLHHRCECAGHWTDGTSHPSGRLCIFYPFARELNRCGCTNSLVCCHSNMNRDLRWQSTAMVTDWLAVRCGIGTRLIQGASLCVGNLRNRLPCHANYMRVFIFPRLLLSSVRGTSNNLKCPLSGAVSTNLPWFFHIRQLSFQIFCYSFCSPTRSDLVSSLSPNRFFESLTLQKVAFAVVFPLLQSALLLSEVEIR